MLDTTEKSPLKLDGPRALNATPTTFALAVTTVRYAPMVQNPTLAQYIAQYAARTRFAREDRWATAPLILTDHPMPATYQSAFATMVTMAMLQTVCDASQGLTATGVTSTLAPHLQPPLQELSTQPSASVIAGITGWRMHRVLRAKKGRGVGLVSRTPVLLICGRP